MRFQLAGLLNRSRRWRERGWTPISAEDYRAAWHHWGGSVATHPDVVAELSDLAGIPVDYLGWFADGSNSELQAALPAWGRHIALSREVLKQRGKRDTFDLGNAEIILPQAPGSLIRLRHRARYVSDLHADHVHGLRRQRQDLALARPPEEYSKKFLYNQRRERRLLEGQGGVVRPIGTLSAQDIADMYTELFEKRWGFPVPGKPNLVAVFSRLHTFLTGAYITVQDQPAAIQILYRAQAPGWISIEYVNSGVDPAWNALSPGSVLSFVNTQDAWTDARSRGKPLRYSFGRVDREYKMRWCYPTPSHATG